MTASLLYTPEQELFRLGLAKFLADHVTEQRTREWMDTESGFDPNLWARMVDLGLPGLLIPDRYGGSEAGPGELAATFEQAGRCLLATPLLACGVLAPVAVAALDDEAAQEELLPAIAGGRLMVSLADRQMSQPVSHRTATAHQQDGRWYLDGVVRHVLDGQNADLILAPVRTESGPSLFVVDPRHPSARVRPLATLDQTRKLADVELAASPVRLIGSEGRAGPAVERALCLGALAVAAEGLGGSETALQMAVEHARTRIQFGRPIGSFQAVKHRCADMKLLLEASRAAVHKAVAGAEPPGGPWIDVSVAKVYSCDAFFRIAADNIQIHGGMGCTWEHPAHLYLRRAKSLQQLLGTSSRHRSSIARHLRLVE